MSKDTSNLYSGATSASLVSQKSQAVQEKRGERSRSRDEKQRQLKPHAEAIKEVFDREIHRLLYGAYTNEEAMSDDEFRRERQSRRRAYESLILVQRQIMLLLREPRRTSVDDQEIAKLIEEDEA